MERACEVTARRLILPDGQIAHTRHAKIARRANLSQASALAPSGKSQRCSRASRLDEEGRFGRSSRYVGRGCGGRGWHVRRTWRMRTAKSCGSGAPKQALRSRDPSCERRWQPSKGHRGERDINRNTIAQGMPADPALPVVTAACFFCCRRAMGEVVTRHSLRPLRFPRAKLFAALGRECAAGSRRCAHLRVV